MQNDGNKTKHPEIRRRKPTVDARIERQIITGMILDDHFLRQTKAFANLLQADFARRVAEWCVEYHSQYGKPPGKHIEDLYLQHKREVPEDEAAVLEEFLSGISEEYERSKGFNADFILDKAEQHFRLVSLKGLQGCLQRAIIGGKPDEGEQYIHNWLEKKTETQTGEVLGSAVGLEDLLKMDIPVRPMIIDPLIRETTLCMIVGPTGLGKTMLALALGLATCTGGEVGSAWKCDRSLGVLYVDGEMNAEEMRTDRIRPLLSGFPKPVMPFQLLSNDLRYLQERKPINLARQAHRDELYAFLQKEKKIGLVVLDNVSALTPGIDENSKEAWDPINQWLISLRFLGLAVILLHHAGKSGKQRGTSGREDAMDVIVNLERPPGYKSEDGCRFVVKFEKARGIFGDNAKPVEFQFIRAGDKTLIKTSSLFEDLRRLIVAALGQGFRGKEISASLRSAGRKCSEATVTYHKKWAENNHYLTEDGKFTPEGVRRFGGVKIDDLGGDF